MAYTKRLSLTRCNHRHQSRRSRKLGQSKMAAKEVVVSLADKMLFVAKATVRCRVAHSIWLGRRPEAICCLQSSRCPRRRRGCLNAGTHLRREPTPGATKGARVAHPPQACIQLSFEIKMPGRQDEASESLHRRVNADSKGASRRPRQRHSQCSPLARLDTTCNRSDDIKSWHSSHEELRPIECSLCKRRAWANALFNRSALSAVMVKHSAKEQN